VKDLSQAKKDRKIPVSLLGVSDLELAQIIARALREDFGDTPSAIKEIGLITSANLRAIKNWYEAKNMPNSKYLLILARSSPSILRFILMQVGGEELWDAFQFFVKPQKIPPQTAKRETAARRERPKAVTLNGTLPDLNERQIWFLTELVQGNKTTAEDISERWTINLRTARRDIAELKTAGHVEFRGARRTGSYAPCRQAGK
jgi:hypothetical protein